MVVKQLNPGPCWTYLLTDENNKCVLIDPVIIHMDNYLNILKDKNLVLTHVIDTHTHADHISAGSALKEATGCEYVMHELAPAKCVTKRIKEGDIITVAGKQAKVLATPGHTKDSVSLLFEDMLFTGDFLFLDDAGAGRDDLPGGDATAHWESLQKINEVTGDVMVYPAHEYRDRTPSNLTEQRKTNPYLKGMTKDEFKTYIDDLKLGPADWMKDVLKANYNCSTDPNAAYIPEGVSACETKGTLTKEQENVQVVFIDKKEFENLTNPILLDVREPEELEGPLGHIDGVINIPVGLFNIKLDKIEQYKNDEIVVICRSGSRATTAARVLATKGFTNTKVLKGGMVAYHSN